MLKPGLAKTLHEIGVSLGLIREAKTAPKPKATRDDGMLLVQAAVDALVQWFFDRNSKPTHLSLVDNPDWKKSRGVTGADGRYHHTIPVPLRGVTAEQMDAKLRLACAAAGMLEIADAETGEVA
ncbi:hypothetical protein I6F35_28050 [Bradyrhizobium sp. BRP22]|uniref:hypothetical protein n=1 Tax=Bradyrhizobium sp. BRP22 TaxID=2793821 RepID=UPI001CD4814B|nr:hypothetical protein [Bradyrhizobium sp. BRP22]MCA1457027.1 hypothetical protein [Bradyrhizobium sp. BRP22]